MILGIGCDIVKISRFAKDRDFLVHFMKKYFTANEIAELEKKVSNSNVDQLAIEIATRFSAKEAISKALGTGFQNGITLKDIEIIHNDLGAPTATLYNKALSRAYEISKHQNFQMHLTLSNERDYANAVAVLESL